MGARERRVSTEDLRVIPPAQQIFEVVGDAKPGDRLAVTLKQNGAKGTRALLSQGERGLDAPASVWGVARFAYLRSARNHIPICRDFIFTVQEEFDPLKFATEIWPHAKVVQLKKSA